MTINKIIKFVETECFPSYDKVRERQKAKGRRQKDEIKEKDGNRETGDGMTINKIIKFVETECFPSYDKVRERQKAEGRKAERQKGRRQKLGEGRKS